MLDARLHEPVEVVVLVWLPVTWKKHALTLQHSHTFLTFFLSRAVKQTETDGLGLRNLYKEERQQCHTEYILPCPYLLGLRCSHDAKPAQVLSPVMEDEIKQNDAEAKGKRHLVVLLCISLL